MWSKSKPTCTSVYRRWSYPLRDYKLNQIFWASEPGPIVDDITLCRNMLNLVWFLIMDSGEKWWCPCDHAWPLVTRCDHGGPCVTNEHGWPDHVWDSGSHHMCNKVPVSTKSGPSALISPIWTLLVELLRLREWIAWGWALLRWTGWVASQIFIGKFSKLEDVVVKFPADFSCAGKIGLFQTTPGSIHAWKKYFLNFLNKHFTIFIGPKSDHCLPLSVFYSPTNLLTSVKTGHIIDKKG